MKKIITAFLFLMTCSFSFAQEDVEAMRANARKFMQNGDMDNALLILNKATEANPNNKDLKKELIFAYFYKKEYDKALELIQPLLESADVDAQTIQLAGNVFKAQISDANGRFTNAINIGSLTSSSSTGIITAIIPDNTTEGSAYRFRVVSTDSARLGEDNGTNITIHALPAAIISSNGISICGNDSLALVSTPAVGNT